MKTTRVLSVGLGILSFVIQIAAEPTNTASVSAEGKTQMCFQCYGTGAMKCTVPSCVNGQADCPGPCLKLSQGSWIHMNVAGHSPHELWRKFPTKNGGYTAWTQGHVGEVIKMQNGDPVNAGKCTVCGGSTHVKCGVCKGTGKVVCNLCSGKKAIPASWTTFDNPTLKTRPSRFKLKNGTELVGRKTATIGSTITIQTEKEKVKVDAADIVSEQKP